jgi:transcriptional regulator with XRE-family HTH domain
MTLNQKIKTLRIERKWSQKKLAAKTGVTQSYISKVESGEILTISPCYIEKLEAVFQIKFTPADKNPLPQSFRKPVCDEDALIFKFFLRIQRLKDLNQIRNEFSLLYQAMTPYIQRNTQTKLIAETPMFMEWLSSLTK